MTLSVLLDYVTKLSKKIKSASAYKYIFIAILM